MDLANNNRKHRMIDIINPENDHWISTHDLGKMTVLK